MSTEVTAECCEICGRAKELAHRRLCSECSGLVQRGAESRTRGWGGTWLLTLLLVVGAAGVYCLIASHYAREIFWFLVGDRPL